MPKASKWYRSKKLWFAVATGLIAALKQAGYAVPEEAIFAGIALIVGQGIADIGKSSPPPQPVVVSAAPPTTSPGDSPRTPATLMDYIYMPLKSPTPLIPAQAVISTSGITPEQAEALFLKPGIDRYQAIRLEYEQKHPSVASILHPYLTQPVSEVDPSLSADLCRKMIDPEAAELVNAYLSLSDDYSMLEGLKAGRIKPYNLGPLGYRIMGLTPIYELS